MRSPPRRCKQRCSSSTASRRSQRRAQGRPLGAFAIRERAPTVAGVSRNASRCASQSLYIGGEKVDLGRYDVYTLIDDQVVTLTHRDMVDALPTAGPAAVVPTGSPAPTVQQLKQRRVGAGGWVASVYPGDDEFIICPPADRAGRVAVARACSRNQPPEVRQAARRALWDALRAPCPPAELVEAAWHSPDPTVRDYAIALQRPPLWVVEAWATNKRPELRATAAQLLDGSNPRHRSLLGQLAGDADLSVRQAAFTNPHVDADLARAQMHNPKLVDHVAGHPGIPTEAAFTYARFGDTPAGLRAARHPGLGPEELDTLIRRAGTNPAVARIAAGHPNLGPETASRIAAGTSQPQIVALAGNRAAIERAATDGIDLVETLTFIEDLTVAETLARNIDLTDDQQAALLARYSSKRVELTPGRALVLLALTEGPRPSDATVKLAARYASHPTGSAYAVALAGNPAVHTRAWDNTLLDDPWVAAAALRRGGLSDAAAKRANATVAAAQAEAAGTLAAALTEPVAGMEAVAVKLPRVAAAIGGPGDEPLAAWPLQDHHQRWRSLRTDRPGSRGLADWGYGAVEVVVTEDVAYRDGPGPHDVARYDTGLTMVLRTNTKREDSKQAGGPVHEPVMAVARSVDGTLLDAALFDSRSVREERTVTAPQMPVTADAHTEGSMRMLRRTVMSNKGVRRMAGDIVEAGVKELVPGGAKLLDFAEAAEAKRKQARHLSDETNAFVIDLGPNDRRATLAVDISRAGTVRTEIVRPARSSDIDALRDAVATYAEQIPMSSTERSELLDDLDAQLNSAQRRRTIVGDQYDQLITQLQFDCGVELYVARWLHQHAESHGGTHAL